MIPLEKGHICKMTREKAIFYLIQTLESDTIYPLLCKKFQGVGR